jgi:hypothetical protein
LENCLEEDADSKGTARQAEKDRIFIWLKDDQVCVLRDKHHLKAAIHSS